MDETVDPSEDWSGPYAVPDVDETALPDLSLDATDEGNVDAAGNVQSITPATETPEE